MAVRYEIAVGLNSGHKTTKIRRVNYKGNKKVKGLRGASVKNVSFLKEKNEKKMVINFTKCCVHEEHEPNVSNLNLRSQF